MTDIIFETGDIFDSPYQIAHVVNCQGVMGSGFAKQVKEKFPEVYNTYVSVCEMELDSKKLLGRVFCTGRVINLHSQDYYGTDKRQLNYGALAKCLQLVNSQWDHVAIPYLMGCGLAGGDWKIVLELLEFCAPDTTFHIYKKEV